jgi:outer membrane protein assembly factor BamD (BamD/ComL family)
MEESYEKLGMTALAASTQKVLSDNTASVAPDQSSAEQKKSWWKFW